MLKGHRIFLFAGSGGDVPEVVQEQCPHLSLPHPAKHRVRGALGLVSVGVFVQLKKTASIAVPWYFWWTESDADQCVDIFPLLSLGSELNGPLCCFYRFWAVVSPLFPGPLLPPAHLGMLVLSFLLPSALTLCF